MSIGLSMLFCLGEPFSSLVKRLNEVEVKCVELVDEGLHTLNKKRVNALKEIAKSNSIEYTVHAPFVDINIASPNSVLRRVVLKRLEKSIAYTSQLNGRKWVFHSGLKTGVSEFYPNLDWQLNLRSVRNLLTISRKYDVEISIENTPEPFPFLLKSIRDFTLFYSELGNNIGMTLDIGHTNISRQTLGFIQKFSDKIVHVHASDNDGNFDAHLGIGRGKVDWKTIADTLKGINYRGIVMLESVEHIEESLQILNKLFD